MQISRAELGALAVFASYFSIIGGLFLLILRNLPPRSVARPGRTAYVFIALALGSFAHTWFCECTSGIVRGCVSYYIPKSRHVQIYGGKYLFREAVSFKLIFTACIHSGVSRTTNSPRDPRPGCTRLNGRAGGSSTRRSSSRLGPASASAS